MNPLTASQVVKALHAKATPERAKVSQRFFKTGKGEYGEGDVFIGITMPEQRVVAKQFLHLPLSEILKLLHSPVHEERMTALVIMVYQFERSKVESERKKIFDTYLANTRWINNWDLVDVTAPRIVGAYLGSHALPTLKPLARSKNLWEKRIAMVSTQYLINQGDCAPALAIAEVLLTDPHDLMHKAAGWMLREAGKKCSHVQLEKFLQAHGNHMPRTMLRYAIEKFPKSKQKKYLAMGKSESKVND